MTRRTLVLATLSLAAPALAQQAEPDDGEEIVVTGQRPRGSVTGTADPEIVLNPADVRALGAGSLNEVLSQIGARTGGSGRPVVTLLEGRRIGSFREIRDIPPEAIARIDVLSPEVALSYGYAVEGRVVNIVLRERFRALTFAVDQRIATAGGRQATEGKAGLLRLFKGGRLNLDLGYTRAGLLTEAERGLTAPLPAAPFAALDRDPAAFRSLLPATSQFDGALVYSRALGPSALTLTGNVTATERQRLSGLNGVVLAGGGGTAGYLPLPGVLSQSAQTLRGELSALASGPLPGAGWRYTADVRAVRTENQTIVGRGFSAEPLQAALLAGSFNPAQPVPPALLVTRPADIGRSTSTTGEGGVLVNGALFDLPGGKAVTAIRAEAQAIKLDSTRVRAGMALTPASLSRQRAGIQGNLTLPIASRRRDVLAGLGDLSLAINGRVDRFSDIGTLTGYGAALTWEPVARLELRLSHDVKRAAPDISLLGDPVVQTPGVAAFDLVRGESVLVTQTTGGNLDLAAPRLRQWRAGFSWRPVSGKDLTLQADYERTRTRDPISRLPAVTAAVQAAFHERFVRDAGGRLVAIDDRPLNLAAEDRSQLRYGVSLGLPLKSKTISPDAVREAFGGRRPSSVFGSPPAPSPAARAPEAQGARGGMAGGGGRGGMFGGGQGGRLQLSLFHTVRLTDALTLRDGLAPLDRLNGAVGSGFGGTPRHAVEGEFGLFNNGFGARAQVEWQAATRVDTGSGALRFGPVGKLDLRVFADLGRQLSLVKDARWLIGTRVTLAVDNVFDRRQRVTDAAGQTPTAYQPAFIDPLGRSIRLQLRKQFF